MTVLDSFRLDGKVAVVTGASSGLGVAFARALAEAGADVALGARRADRLADTQRLVEAQGHRAIAVRTDVAQPEDCRALIEAAVSELGRVDVLVNNAGAGQVADSETLAPEDWQRIIDLDLTAPFRCAQAVAGPMLAAGRGVIVNISSLTGHIGLARRAAYTAAKHGLEGVTKTLGVEWARRGVRVMSVAPAYVDTELLAGTSRAGGFTLDDVARRTPMGRLAEPQEVARVVAFLASDEASFLTGSSVRVDGGWLADGGWEGMSPPTTRGAR
jgi:3-oxoacyl-[acyl-carrier protein] reductase